MEIPYFVIHAFASRPFAGSPAAVCILQEPLADDVLAAIARESLGLETTFLRPVEGGYEIRWLAPARELTLCTHATLAAGSVILRHVYPGTERVTFLAESGPLEVWAKGELFALSLPRLAPTPTDDVPDALSLGLRVPPAEVLRAGKYVAVYNDPRDVEALAPDLARLAEAGAPGVIVTAPGGGSDFVMRSFGFEGWPAEEQVSGSAFSRLVPFWAQRLGQPILACRQLSARGGEVYCTDRETRVEIAGPVVLFAHGRLYV